MNTTVAVNAALQRHDLPAAQASAVASSFAAAGHESPAGDLVAIGFAALHAALDFDPKIPLLDGFTALLPQLSDAQIEALAEEVVSADSERYFAAADSSRVVLTGLRGAA